jgi:hypothetical protein
LSTVLDSAITTNSAPMITYTTAAVMRDHESE